MRYKQRPLLANAVANAAAIAPGRIVVVLGANAARIRLALSRCGHEAARVHNRDWTQGIASSLRAGLAALPRSARSALIVLTDQPRVDARALGRLVRASRAQPGRAIASAYAGGIGVPAILPRRLWRSAMRLTGDVGARKLLAAEHVVRVALPEAELDVDTAEDLAKL